MTWVSVLVLVLLLGVEALFVGAEIALVSLRESQVRALGERSRRGQRVARLVADPNRFLAAVQLGVTTAALLSSAYGALTLSRPLGRELHRAGLGTHLANGLALVAVTLLLTYATLVLGELAPKRIALQRAERVAETVAPLLDRVALLSRPVIWLLSRSTDLVVRLAGGDPGANRPPITEEELRDLVTAHESLSRDERRLIEEVFEAGERGLREVMVPRTEVEFLDASMTVTRALRQVQGSPHSRFPVVRGSHDDVVGFVHARDLFAAPAPSRGRSRVGELARPVTLLPDTNRVLPALSELRRSGQHLAVVVDEYGGTAGIVTLEDLIEELIGEIRDEYDVGTPHLRRLVGGDVEVDGLLNRDDFAEETGIALPEGPFETVAGYVMAALGRLPGVGDTVDVDGATLTVTDLDGRRAARVRVTARADGENEA